MRWLSGILLVGALLLAPNAVAQSAGVLGQWREPGGSVLGVERCGADICVVIVVVQPGAPSRLDLHNPDAALRTRPMCGVRIGTGFKPTDADHAEGGKLYDPKTGKTYDGMIWVQNGQLHLRGYVGIKVFGRTQIWQRTSGVSPCQQ